MKNILATFVKYPFYAKVVILFLLLIGGISMVSLKKATFPIVETRTITISVSYPGASPEQMEEGVTSLIEQAIRGIPGIKEFESQSRENFSSITVTSLASYDVDELLTDIKNSVDGISNFPASAEKPVVSKRRSRDMAIFLSLKSKSSDIMALQKEANRIEDDFLATGFISQISIIGLPNKLEISVEADETQLKRYGLTFSDIQNAISANNRDIRGGLIRNPKEQMIVLSRNRSTDPEEIEQIVLRTTPEGRVIRIGDVASVALQFEETPNESYVEGDRNVMLFIQKLRNEDLEQISDFVNDYIDEYNETHEDMEIEVLMDFLELINNQLGILYSNGFVGILLVLFMLSMLLNYRLSFWVAWGIPASFLGMFILAFAFGVTLNLISLFGMILIIGILVDDGIVIGENIFTHYEMGKSPRRAAIEGTQEVLPAVFTSVSTTMIAFMPLFFIEGNLQMMYEMAFVVVACLLFSLFEGMFVLPGHLVSSNALRPINSESRYGKLRKRTDQFIMWVRDKRYLPFLERTIRHKFLTLSVVLSLFIFTAGAVMSGIIPFTFFPASPSDMFTVELALKPGTNENITKEKLFWLEQKIWEANQQVMDEHPEDTISYIERTQVSIGSAFSGTEAGPNAGSIRVFLHDGISETKVNDQLIKRRIAQNVGTIPEAYKFGVGASNRFGAPVSISLFGYDLEELDEAKEELKAELKKMTSLYNVMDNSQLGSQEIRIKLKPEAYAMGLNHASLMSQVRNGYFGALAQRMQEGKNEIWVYVRYPRDNRESLGQLEKMRIETPQGSYPLSQLATLEKGRSLNKINRYNGRREVRVDAYLKDANEAVPPILDYVEASILPDILEKYPDVSFMHQGQRKDTDEEMAGLQRYFGLAFLIIILIIMVYFKSFSQGFIILMMIPFGVLGALWGHSIHGVQFSLMSLWGVVALSGTIINDAIVFLSKFNRNLREGMNLLTAVKEAGRRRFRAIVLTTITTTAGLMPLILEGSADAQFLIPMAISLAYGILFGTFFILMILPHFILMVNRLKCWLKKLRTGERPAPEQVEVAVINMQIESTLKNAMEKEI